MKAYMGYDRPGVSQEGACLIFAPNAKVARKMLCPILDGWFGTEWIDVVAKFIRDLPEHLRALDNGTEQIIEEPPSCSCCEMWGGHLQEGMCSFCEEAK